MSNRFDLAAALGAGVQDKDGAWTFIRRFAEAWLTPLHDGDGYSGAELDAAEDRLGFKLPAALREAYLLFGRRADLCGTMNFLAPPDELCVYQDTGLLRYHWENQGVWQRYIRLVDLDRDDPPTVQSCDDHHDGHLSGIAWSERLSIACIEMVLDESFWGADTLAMHGQLLEKEVPEMERRFTPLGFPPLPVEQADCCISARGRWYVGEDAILRLKPFLRSDEYEHRRGPWNRPWSRAGLSIRGRTPEAIDALRESLPTEWFHWEWRQPEDPYPPKP